MGIYPEPLVKLINQFSKLPGIGKNPPLVMALFVLRSNRGLAEAWPEFNRSQRKN